MIKIFSWSFGSIFSLLFSWCNSTLIIGRLFYSKKVNGNKSTQSITTETTILLFSVYCLKEKTWIWRCDNHWNVWLKLTIILCLSFHEETVNTEWQGKVRNNHVNWIIFEEQKWKRRKQVYLKKKKRKKRCCIVQWHFPFYDDEET